VAWDSTGAKPWSPLTQSRLTDGVAIVGDALDLPFADKAFDRVLTGHFYGHLPPDEREVFLAEARHVADELIVIESALRPGVEAEQWQERRSTTARGILASTSAISRARSSPTSWVAARCC